MTQHICSGYHIVPKCKHICFRSYIIFGQSWSNVQSDCFLNYFEWNDRLEPVVCIIFKDATLYNVGLQCWLPTVTDVLILWDACRHAVLENAPQQAKPVTPFERWGGGGNEEEGEIVSRTFTRAWGTNIQESLACIYQWRANDLETLEKGCAARHQEVDSL